MLFSDTPDAVLGSLALLVTLPLFALIAVAIKLDSPGPAIFGQERLGRLRRLVLEWLNEPEFRTHVSGFQPAHPRHGGGGALYVRLRRPKGHAN